MLVLGLPSRGQIVFQGVHVRWQFRDLPENDNEVKIEEQRCDVEPCDHGRCHPCRKQDLVRLLIRWEHCTPTADFASLHVRVTSRHQHRENVEWDESGIGDERKEVIAGGAGCRSRFGITN